MEADTRESRWQHQGSGRSNNGDRSPGGSVKRARERVQAGIPREIPPPIPFNEFALSSAKYSPPKPAPAQESPAASIGFSHSNTTPTHQSPKTSHSPPDTLPRASPLQGHGSPRNYWDEDQRASNYSVTSRPSTIATGTSEGSIPEFPKVPPVPSSSTTANTQSQRRGGPGHPPTSRRGVSSYYSQASFVPPIPESEEMPTGHISYASSRLMPESWGDGPPEYYMSPSIEEEEDGIHTAVSSARQSKDNEYGDHVNLVEGPPRTKPLQPFMETIDSGDESTSLRAASRKPGIGMDGQPRRERRLKSGHLSSINPQQRHNIGVRGNGVERHPYSGYESDATFLDSPISMSPKTPMPGKAAGSPDPYSAGGISPISRGSPVDPRVHEILGNLEKGGAIASADSAPPGPQQGRTSQLEKGRRPPPLNLDGASNSASRASVSSLPEMIRRATRLASNLDRGKTASRHGMMDMMERKDFDRHLGQQKSKRASISDMLAAFPSPTASTSPGMNKPANWGAIDTHGKSNLSKSQTVPYKADRPAAASRERRCCGLPLWLFILLTIVAFLLIAAAVIIPVTLVVLPRENKSSAPTTTSCQKSKPCLNSGASVVVNNSCSCICVGDYTGATCSTKGDNSCTTTSIQGPSGTTYNDATFGSNVPRLLNAASTNFSVPLSGWTLAATFSRTDASCSAENSLLTFTPSSRHRRRSLSKILSGESTQVDLNRDYHATLQNGLGPLAQLFSWFLRSSKDVSHPRRLSHLAPSSVSSYLDSSKTLKARSSAQSSNGIVFAAGGGSYGGGNIPTDAPPASSSSGSGATLAASKITNSTVDFARAAVLFILQESNSLSAATSAVNALTTVLAPGVGSNFSSSQTASGNTVDLGGGVSINFSSLTITLSNGTMVGGKK